MQRRQFITILYGAATWPVAAHAQQPATPTIGYLGTRSPGDDRYLVAAFHRGLVETGYVEGRNVTVEYRWAEGNYVRLPALAADLVGRGVAVIAAFSPPAALAVKAATAIIPIVFTSGSQDPVKAGLVDSLHRPGGNLTGVSRLSSELTPKRLELLREVVPNASVVALLVNPTNPATEATTKSVQAAARSLGCQIRVFGASTDRETDEAFASIAREKIGALLISVDAFFNGRIDHLAALALRHAVPAIYEARGFAAAGGLMSYGAGLSDAYREVGVYVGRILKGAKPADLPVQQQTKVDLAINLKTARVLGLTVSLPLLGRADEVIE
jgi:putative ABC transport system substrate-binding protein